MAGPEALLWQPFTQMLHDRERKRQFVRAKGTLLFDCEGRPIYDAVSSIWTIIHGHCHPRIVEAISRQAERLDHATMLGASNPVAIELASELCRLTGKQAVMFSSDGASAVEAAIKIAVQFWQNTGEPHRTRFVRLVDAYHGDTAGAMSVSGMEAFKARFGSLTFSSLPFDDSALLHHDDVAGVIVEPLVQAAAGMRIVQRASYEALRNIKPLVIVDEIATGFGRTGEMFAFHGMNLEPDIVCLGKALSGGSLALSATLTSRRIYEAFLGDLEQGVHFYHGHSYSGNPIACAAALASLNIFAEEGTLQRAGEIAQRAAGCLESFRKHPLVREIRQVGTMIGVELEAQAIDRRSSPTVGWRVADALYERGHFTRPIGDVVQFVPPLSSKDEEIDAFFEAFDAVLS